MEERYGNLFDYLAWRGDLTLEESAFNVVDSLIFSVIAYVHFPDAKKVEGMTLREAVATLEEIPYEERYKGLFVMQENCLRFTEEASRARRFRDLIVTHVSESFGEESEKQFAAMSLLLPDDTVFLAYRGTDNTLTGWKEDFNMSFMTSTPAQEEAARYAAQVAADFDRGLRIGGHSKGGNLAVWAAAHLPEQVLERVGQVFNHDGPGFSEAFLAGEEFMRIRDRVFSFVPESSIVGVLMAHCDYITIRSTNYSIMQHDPFSWKLMGKHFLCDTERSKSGRRLERQINGMFEEMSGEEKEELVEKVYNMLQTVSGKRFIDLDLEFLQNLFPGRQKLSGDSGGFLSFLGKSDRGQKG